MSPSVLSSIASVKSCARLDLLRRFLQLASAVPLLRVGGGVCLGWLDGPEDLDKCRLLGDFYGAETIRWIAIFIAFLTAALPPGLGRWMGVAQIVMLVILGGTCLMGLMPNAIWDSRVVVLWLASLSCSMVALALTIVRLKR